VTLDVELFGNLAPGAPRRQSIPLAAPAVAGEIARGLGVDPEAIGLVTLNGVLIDLEDEVAPGRRLCFFPPLSGG
jgi:molybdopterin converting factor small subunit